MKNFTKIQNWKLRAGIAILILSFSMTPMILLTPFLHADAKTKIILTTTWIIIGNT